VSDDAMRVQKFLSKAGYCSRRQGEDLMRQGRVQVNGDVCRELGSKVTPGRDTVEVDGRRVSLPDAFTYLLLNKPTGYVTTTDDPQGRKTVLDFLEDDAPRLWPVGRLDMDSSGALLLTNDGKLTHRLTHPKFEARKRYVVEVQGTLRADDAGLASMRDGMRLPSGDRLQPARIQVLGHPEDRTRLEVVLTEGKNRQIRRMFDAIDHPVESLQRVAVGPVELDDLGAGQVRPLTASEVATLYREVDAEPPERAPAD
jgi:23S rRNA pseudouridine2605 synthase